MDALTAYFINKTNFIITILLNSIKNIDDITIQITDDSVLLSKGNNTVRIDIANVINAIATKDGNFDYMLADANYENLKILKVVKDRVKVSLATLDSDNKDIEIEKFRQITEQNPNLTIRVIN